eukprot:g14522.t1 g14522   contig9:2038403-2039933(-)
MSASSTIINNKKSPSTPLRQSCFASPAEANVANRTVLRGILVSNRPEYSRMKAALKSHRVEFVDAKVFDERIERFVELERLRALPVPILKKYHSVRSTLLIEELDNLEKMYEAFRTSRAYRKRPHAYVLIDSPEEVLPTNPSALKRCRLTPTTLKRAIDDSGREERRSKRQRLGEAEAVSTATPAVVVAAAPPAVVPVATKRSIGDSGCEERRFKRQRLGETEAVSTATPAVVVAAAPPAVVPVATKRSIGDSGCEERRFKRQRLGETEAVSTATPAVVVAAAAPPAVVPVATKRAIGDSGCEERRSKRQRLGEAEAAVAAPPAVVPVAINQDEASNKVAEQERPVSTATPAVVVAAAAPPAVIVAAAAPPAVVPVAINQDEASNKVAEQERPVSTAVVVAAAPPAVVPVAINQDEASNKVAEQERLAEDKKQRRKERELRRIESSLGPKWKVTASSNSGRRRSSRVRKQTVFFRDLVW